MPSADRLVDRFGRVATDLRVSLTDRCNLRCTYCMPEEGLAWLPREEQLTDDEMIRLVRIAVELLGVTEVRFTGGEPLIRPGLLGIIAAAAALRPRPRLSVTTNGIGLDRLAVPLRDAGLDRVNVSLDTLDPARFATLTRRDRHADVLAGLRAAAAAGLTPVKINTVLMRGINDDEAPDAAAVRPGARLSSCGSSSRCRWTPSTGGTGTRWSPPRRSWPALAAFDLLPDPVARGAAPAETWLVAGYTDAAGEPARVGVIGSVTRPFCGDCDRTRLTADGQIRNCLFATEETDLRGLLRAGADDEEIADGWRAAMWGKRAGHGIDDPTFLQPARPMSAIGG